MLGSLRIFALTAATMVAFAANSLLCRGALRGGAIDAAQLPEPEIAPRFG